MIDIESIMTLDENSNIEFLLSLRKRWADVVYPALVSEFNGRGGELANVPDGEEFLKTMDLYPWFSHIERGQQKLMWKAAGDVVVSRRKLLLDQIYDLPSPPLGELVINEGIDLPGWYTDYDIHIQPGSFYSDDLSAYVYEFGARIVMLRDNDGFKFHSLFAKTVLPEIKGSTRVVDIGCGFGKSTRPLVSKYPKAEIIGVDLAAPGLRLAHAGAEADGLAIKYINADGRYTGLESGSCDVVTGTMVLHEMPSAAMVEVIQEAARLLKPGGQLHFLEFKETGEPFRDATIYGHAERNNEPFFRDLFATDLIQAAHAAGLIDAHWTPFDEREKGLSPEGWGARKEWHFPWAVLSAKKAEA
jgi:ubiquinone/menaquinone biosynthesis C-methylase UbiE